MLKNIREIGIFMIAAQTVIHFAPGRQYEKYIKSVSGIIILLLFLRPFLQLSGAEWKDAEAVLEKLEEVTDMPALQSFEGSRFADGAVGWGTGVGSTVTGRMETKIRELLNRELEGEEYCIEQVSLRITENPLLGGEMELDKVEIRMGKKEQTKGADSIQIDKIVIGDETDTETEQDFSEYCARFAAILGIEENRVEVRADGRG